MMMSASTAAHETTTNARANAIRALLEQRDQWEAICEDPSLIPNAVEECLRFSGSVVAWRRFTTKPATIRGVNIPPGANVLIVMASGNRDEDVFVEPDVLDVRRPNARRHLAFGFGNHTCLAAPLARLELRVILEELTRRLPHMRLIAGQQFPYAPNTSFRGPRTLLVEWDPADNPMPSDRL
jgi:cytochrome P450